MMVGVSIVSFNTRELVLNCLKKLRQFEVWVVDNNSTDGTADVLEEIDWIKLIKNDTNLGFARAQNQALKKISQKYLLLLNPDTTFESSDITKLAEFMEMEDCGVASCRIVNEKGELDANGGDLPFGMALFAWLFNLEKFWVKKNFHRRDSDYYKEPHVVEWVAGTFMMVKRDVFLKTGYLNEGYFMYFEDVEFCYRAKKSGFKVMINPDVQVMHIGGASSKNPSFNQWKGEFKGLMIFYGQFGLFARMFARFMIYIAIFLRILAFSLVGDFRRGKTYAKVLFNI